MMSANDGNLECIEVAYFLRRPFPGYYSIESIFSRLCDRVGEHGVKVTRRILPFYSKGVLARVRSTVWASRNQRGVNHVTGDVHFITCGLDPHRTVLTIHDLTILNFRHGLKRRLLKLFWYDIPLRRCAIVTTPSQQVKEDLLEQCQFASKARIEVVPNAVSPVFAPSLRDFRQDRPRILHIGTAPNKNLLRLAEALEGVTCKLHVVGNLSEPQLKALEKYRIDFENSQNLSEEDVYQAYCNCDIVSFVSLAEGFGMPIVEAQWVERPVVTSNCSCMPEVAGPQACLVDPSDVRSIKDGFVRVISDRHYREKLIEAGRMNRTRFDPDVIAARYVSLYKELHAKRRVKR